MGIGIKRDIEELVKHDVIDEETARRINAYYASKKSSINATTIFSIVAAFFIGMGIISIISYNWDNIPVAIRSVLSLVPLGVASYGSYYVLKNKIGFASWREGIAILQALSFTASYALICQTFQIQSDSDAFVYICLLTAVPFMFIFKSAGLSFITIFAICCEVATDIDYLMWTMLLIANAVFVYIYYIKREETLLFKLRVAILPFTIPIVIYGYFKSMSDPSLLVCVLAALYYSLHLVIKERCKRSRGTILEIVSYFMLFGIMLICSTMHSIHTIDIVKEWTNTVPVVVISLVQLTWIVYKVREKQGLKWQEWAGFVAIGGIMTQESAVVAILTLMMAGYAIYDSLKICDVKELNVGILALFLWAMFVLKTYDLPFFVNGIILIALGIVLIIMNRNITKKNKTNKGIENE